MMTPQQERKHQIWLRWMRITRRNVTANVSGDLMLRHNEQRTMGDAVDTIDRMRNQPTAIDTLFKK